MGTKLVINNVIRAWRTRGMECARSEIGAVLTRYPRRIFPGVELRERTKLRRGLMYRTLNSLVDAEWVGVDSTILDGRRVNAYFITERGKHLFPTVLANHDIHSGDKLCRQVWRQSCESNVWTRFMWRSSAGPERR